MHFHFVLFLRLIQESDPLKILGWLQKHPERCAFGIDDTLKSIKVIEIQDNRLLRGRYASAVYHQKDSVSIVNVFVWMPPDFHLKMKTTPNPKEPKGAENEATT